MDKVNEYDLCQNYYGDFISTTSPDRRRLLFLRKYSWKIKKTIWHFRVLGPINLLNRNREVHLNGKKRVFNKDWEFNIGEIVEVRSEKEIFLTLNIKDELRGLRFNLEMSKYCGKKYKVFKKVEKIISETTGELRTIINPTYLLEDVTCDGSAHGGCDRTCYCYWRQEWLKRT